MDYQHMESLCTRARSLILRSTTAAGSGHLTSSLSAVELMVGLLFNGSFRYRVNEPEYHNNDRLIFSKGHASPLFYALWVLAGDLSEEELMTLRQFDSVLEGHPTKRFAHTEVATGSLGQGLSVGVGMAMNAKYLDNLPYRTFVLLGDSEMAEGQNYEAMQLASHYKLNNLVAVVDVNRLGQTGETMVGWDVRTYARRAEAFGWDAIMLDDGHELSLVEKAYEMAFMSREKPVMIIAKTVKGKGVSFLENKEGWHGSVLNSEELAQAMQELGEVDDGASGVVESPEEMEVVAKVGGEEVELDGEADYEEPLAPRKAYGHALAEMAPHYPLLVVLDAEVSNSTYAQTFARYHPDRFFEMFIAEQNMVGVAVGLAARGKKPFVSTFGSFFSRAVDQIRVAQYSGVNINFVGSHVGVSIGADGPTQMGLEDIAVMRSILGSVVLQPSDHVSAEKLTKAMIEHPGLCYMRTVRMDVEALYDEGEEFEIGGSKTLRTSDVDEITLVGSGVTIHECLKAHAQLLGRGITTRVIDLYSIKPLDVETIVAACKQTKALVVVEDHFADGGICDAVRAKTVFETTPIHSLAVTKMPRSGSPSELLSYEGIGAHEIVEFVSSLSI